jgi:NTE family protein
VTSVEPQGAPTGGPGIVFVAGGGGAKGAAHVGAMQALEEQGIRPTHFIGTSMGAVVAAMFASGLDSKAAIERLTRVARSEVVKAEPFALLRGLWARGLLKPEPFRAALAQLVPATRFEELRHPLTVTTTALDAGELVLFGALGRPAPLQDALYASCALPLFFPPAIIAGRRHGDGGLRAVLPLEPAAPVPARLVIAVDAGPGFDEAPAPTASTLPPVVEMHNEATGILMAAQTAQTLALWRATPGRAPLLYVRPRVERGATFRVDQIRRYMEEGYRAATAALAGLQSPTG